MTAVYIETTIQAFSTPHEKTRDHWHVNDGRGNGGTKSAQVLSCTSVTRQSLKFRRGTCEDLTTRRIELITDLNLLEVSDAVMEIATIHVDRLVMPRDGAGDALHLALASYYALDVLLTWNCKHLANPNKFGHIDRVNGEFGLSTPLLTTPLNYLSEDGVDGD